MIGVVKPRGIASQSGLSTGQDLLTLLRERQKRLGEKPDMQAVQRLDVPTGGVMVYAKNRQSAGRLTHALAAETSEKIYLAVVCPTPEEKTARLEDEVLHDRKRNLASVVPTGTKDARHAVLEYETLAVRDGRALLKIRLVTGRTHQIRIQMSSRGFPVCGDGKYGSPEKGLLALWALEERFPHPGKNGATAVLFAAPPGEGFFLPFREEIRKEEERL
ncbi:MAG: RNA pseudouridine synthase [Clostridia bacterium]|nr:RNA pseudouridine synthase [Clostridia bacterium]